MNISETDLILNADGSLYHLNLLPGDVADTIILVGDQDRVTEVSKHFDSIELRKGKREFITHTGMLKGKRVSVVSTGIGTDNVDIIINELDALVNVDLNTRKIKDKLRVLNFLRIGTSGAIQANIPVDSLLVSEHAFGLDALMHYYQYSPNVFEHGLLQAFSGALPNLNPYLSSADEYLLEKLTPGLLKGITVTAPGFYSPQGRTTRAASAPPNLLQALQNFEFQERKITNIEMETAGIYGLAKALGHRAISFNVILANRATNTFSSHPALTMEKYIVEFLSRITSL